MATSGALSTNNDNIKYKITITQNSRNVAGNTSSVTVSVRVYRTNTGYTTYGTGTIYCKINGTTYSDSITSSDKITSSGIVLFSKTLNIAHNSDGSKTLTTSAWINHSQFSSSEQSYSQALTSIPRATTPTVNDNDINLGTSVTVSMPRASSSFTHTLRYAFGNTSGTIASGLGTSRAWTVPLSLASQIPSATSGKLTIYCDTYNGSSKIGTKSVTITVRVPSTVVPTISSVTITDNNSAQYTKMGGFVKGKSSLAVKISASGAYSSKISSYSTTGGGKTYSGSSFTVSSLTSAGTVSFKVTIKDSRGRTATTTKSITVIDYDNPVISKFNVVRANSDGTQNDEGSSLLISYAFDISPINNKNDKTFTISMKAANSTSFINLTSGSVYSADTTFIPSGIINPDMTYTVRLTIQDYYKSITHNIEAPTAFTLMDFHSSGKGLSFGKVAQEEGIVDFGLPVKFNNGEAPNGSRTILSGTDIDTLLDPGYYLFSGAVSTTLVNLPFTVSSSGALEVIREGESTQVRQVVTRCSANREIWERVYYSSKWHPWQIIYKGGNRILWTGAYYMSAGQTATLSQKVSEQPNGIVLVFSRYSSGETRNYHFNSFFVPKAFVEEMPGLGNQFTMTTDGTFSVMASKYVYIHDDKIVGNDVNTSSGTGTSGIKYENNGFVLRYVIGI